MLVCCNFCSCVSFQVRWQNRSLVVSPRNRPKILKGNNNFEQLYICRRDLQTYAKRKTTWQEQRQPARAYESRHSNGLRRDAEVDTINRNCEEKCTKQMFMNRANHRCDIRGPRKWKRTALCVSLWHRLIHGVGTVLFPGCARGRASLIKAINNVPVITSANPWLSLRLHILSLSLQKDILFTRGTKVLPAG